MPKCIQCENKFEGRKDAKYCSPKCRMAACRGKSNNLSPEEAKELDKDISFQGTIIEIHDIIRDKIMALPDNQREAFWKKVQSFRPTNQGGTIKV